MKRTFINLFAASTALCIGLAINSACGDTLTAGSINNTDDLTRLVQTLQTEIEKLQSDFNKLSANLKNTKDRVQELELRNEELKKLIEGTGNNGGSSGMFFVDGLWYLPTGYPCGRIKSSNHTTKITYLRSDEEVVNITKMYSFSEYDEYGRITKINYDYSDSGYKYYNSDYKYNGKIVTNIIEYENNDTRYSQVCETEYF